MATSTTIPTADSVPVYLSFKTFRSAIQSLRAHGLPDKLDRTAWASRSGGEQSQIISAFRFLGLMDENDNAQSTLRTLVDSPEDSEAEKSAIKHLLYARYGKLFELNLKTATPGQISDAIGSYGATGATRDRAVRFFLKITAYCGIELSSRLTGGMRSTRTSGTDGHEETEQNGMMDTSTSPRRRRGRRPPTVVNHVQDEKRDSAVKIVTLRDTGGTLTLSGTFNAFELDGEERKLVYDIIDLMKQYERKETASE